MVVTVAWQVWTYLTPEGWTLTNSQDGKFYVSGKSPGEGTGSPLQSSCLENFMDRRSLVGYSPWGGKGFAMTEQLTFYYKTKQMEAQSASSQSGQVQSNIRLGSKLKPPPFGWAVIFYYLQNYYLEAF